jgi:hypothetical protein
MSFIGCGSKLKGVPPPSDDRDLDMANARKDEDPDNDKPSYGDGAKENEDREPMSTKNASVRTNTEKNKEERGIST